MTAAEIQAEALQRCTIDWTIADACYADPTGRTAIRYRLLELARDIGRLRKRLAPAPESSLAFALARIAGHVDALEAGLGPTAAELAHEYVLITGRRAEDVAIEEALAVVDRRTREFRALLGEAAA